ncbi:hypothetical protein KGF54_001172 [Candida jiufengensis]|uniref:uncharacterized protein n=1 Tax=Candida jiufengensis TaxID=497108 RepID=UPI002225371C|nr:uncharacterized protein KGF54_001172 [Candida jiufengensis]KAI5955670.1 hypothetical protein KGF54_001172 [Candida jiufengensis]
MKVSFLISLISLSTMISSKNVYDLRDLKDISTNDKREADAEPKNIADLQALKGSLEIVDDKRDAKNAKSYEEILEALKGIEKRDAKNTPNLGKLFKELQDVKGKRDAKNTPNFDEILKALNSVNDKRDAKNTPNLSDLLKALEDEENTVTKRKNTINISNFVFEEDSKDKREAKNVFNVEKYANLINKRSEQQQVLENNNGETIETENNDLVFTFKSSDCFNNLLQSILPQLKSISIFAGYIRDNSILNSKTESLESNMLIITPTDEAIETNLSNLKPWEFPKNIDDVTNEEEQDKILQDNLNHFLDGHIVTDFQNKIIIEENNDDDSKNEKIILTTLDNGKKLKIKQDLLTQNFFIKVDKKKWIPVDTVKQVENGLIFIINDSLVKP